MKVVTTRGIATIHLPSGPLSLDGAQWHLLKHTLVNSDTSALGNNLQNEHDNSGLTNTRNTDDLPEKYYGQLKKSFKLPNTKGIQPSPSHPSSKTQGEAMKESVEKKCRPHNQWSLTGRILTTKRN